MTGREDLVISEFRAVRAGGAQPYAAWRVIYNLDGSPRGYEYAIDKDGNPISSRVYAQEGRDDMGRPLARPASLPRDNDA